MMTLRVGRPKTLLGITHAKARRDQKELDIRLAFEDRSSIQAIVSFDAVERLAQMFGQLASAVRPQHESECASLCSSSVQRREN
jgi:hypothetical protein